MGFLLFSDLLPYTLTILLDSPPELTTYTHLLVLGAAIGKPNLRQKLDVFVY